MNTRPYRTLFLGTLVQESFLSVGGSEDTEGTVDSPLCRDGLGQLTLRGSGLAGALIATLRRCLGGVVPASISGSDDGRQPSAWRFFHSHPAAATPSGFRQHVSIDARTGAAATGLLFDAEVTLPDTCWPFLLEVDPSLDESAVAHARTALGHWVAGRCLLGREVARGMGWMRLEGLREYSLTAAHLDAWPSTDDSEDYPTYIRTHFGPGVEVPVAAAPPPGWIEMSGTIGVGPYRPDWFDGDDDEAFGIDSLSVGAHSGENIRDRWNDRFIAPDAQLDPASTFDPDFSIATYKPLDAQSEADRVPFIPGSSLRGPLRHALGRLLRARGEERPSALAALFGTVDKGAKLLIRDALLDPPGSSAFRLAWLQHHAEDEFAGGAYGPAKFDRVAVMEGRFGWKMVLEEADVHEQRLFRELLGLARAGQVAVGGGQWRGHGWVQWSVDQPADQGEGV